jgi:hypothetical protein
LSVSMSVLPPMSGLLPVLLPVSVLPPMSGLLW